MINPYTRGIKQIMMTIKEVECAGRANKMAEKNAVATDLMRDLSSYYFDANVFFLLFSSEKRFSIMITERLLNCGRRKKNYYCLYTERHLITIIFAYEK